MKPLLIIGSINTDLVIHAERHPLPGETLIGSDFYRTPGGKGANQAIAAARFDVPVKMIGCVGEDALGNSLIENLEENKIDVSEIQKKASHPTGVAIITVAEGENTIVIDQGANALILPEVILENESIIRSAGMLLLQQEISRDVLECALSLAKKHGVPSVLNPAPAIRLTDTMIQNASYITPNEHECAVAFGSEDSHALLREYPKKLLITEGSRGILFCDGENILRVSAHSVEAVDTTGAGDAFNGVFAASLLQKNDFSEALQLANAAAALSVKNHGAQTSPTRQETVEFLKNHRSKFCKEG